MKHVEVIYYAVLREQRGLSQESVLTAAGTPIELYRELRERHGFTLSEDLVKVAIDGAFQSMEQALPERCTLVFIPPVAGG